MTGFGNALRTEREQRGLTLETLCAQTKVSVPHLEALEAERYAELPPGVFRRGIVKAYVAALDLDADEWLPRYQQSYEAVAGPEPQPTAQTWAAFAENVKRNRTPSAQRSGLRWLGVLGMLLLLAAAGYAVWKFILLPKLR